MITRFCATLLVTFVALLAMPAHAADSATLMGVQEAREAALDKSMILIDIRRPEEWKDSGVGDVAHPLDMTQPTFVNELIKLRDANPGAQLGLICATGVRSKALGRFLVRNGIKNVVDVSAGMHGRNGWLASKLPVKPAPAK